jgi:hypothetical protein
MLGMLRTVASKNANVYRMIRELWKGVAVPQSLYGYEVCTVTKKESEVMEKIQNKVGRLGLGANSYVAVEAIQGEMGWSTYRHRISRMKANFKARLLKMEECMWPKQVFDTWVNSKWKKSLGRIDRIYGLNEVLYGMENAKKEIKKKIFEKAQSEWEEGVQKKSTLSLYSRKKEPRMEDIYDGSWASSLLFKARTGSLEVNGRTYRWSGVGEECTWCNLQEKETVHHLMVECEGHRQERELYLESLSHSLGEELLVGVLQSEDLGLGVLLGFECEDERLKRKRREVVARTKMFLMALWRKRL